MKVHFIAIGGSVMHNLALELAQLGRQVTGSDDEIRDPARSRLANAGILPEKEGWFPEKITPDIDFIILGMHAKADNPELLKAQSLGLKVLSFPEFIYQHAKNKQRIVIAGSHGKTTITSMILHVLRGLNYDFDYLVGAQIAGFERMVRLTDKAPIMIIEGDEYLSSPIDCRSKFLHYEPNMLVLSGVAWDHINVFPTLESYLQTFQTLLAGLPKAAFVIYNKTDKILREFALKYLEKEQYYRIPYSAPIYRIKGEKPEIKLEDLTIQLEVLGKHNAANIAAAWEVCRLLAVKKEEFAAHIRTFKGAGMRLEKIYEDENNIIIRDFAHAPSKVRASVEAVARVYKYRNIIACLELHTFSSLNKTFLAQYRGALLKVAKKAVMVNRHTLKMKQMEDITAKDITRTFRDKGVHFVENQTQLLDTIRPMRGVKNVFLMMSSGNFDGLDFMQLIGG